MRAILLASATATTLAGRRLPAVECSRGVKPIQDAKCRPEWKTVGSGTRSAICGRPPACKVFVRRRADLVACGHMSGLLMQSGRLLAQMESADRDLKHAP